MNSTSNPKKRLPTFANDSILESLRDLGRGVGKTLAHDVAGRVAGDTLATLMGATPTTGELKPNQPFKFRETAKTESREMPAPRRLERQPQLSLAAEEAKIKQQIEAVRAELKALAASLKNFHQEIEQAISAVPVDPGIYHLNFFERLKSLLKIMQQQVEDSRTWLALWTSRKKKITYWGLYKKHGTQFGLSSERTMATQAG